VTPSPVAARRCRSAERDDQGDHRHDELGGGQPRPVRDERRESRAEPADEQPEGEDAQRARVHRPAAGEHDLGDRGHPDQREPGGEQVDPERAGAPVQRQRLSTKYR
jgi:hypothetical protein